MDEEQGFGQELSLDAIRPLIHQHAGMLAAAGYKPPEAVAVAAEIAVLVYDDGYLFSLLRRIGEAGGVSDTVERLLASAVDSQGALAA